jgi:hypothetical protein
MTHCSCQRTFFQLLSRPLDLSFELYPLAPPQLGEFALYMILSKEDREYLIGDLAEEYIDVRLKFGKRKASIWYYKQVLTSVWPIICKSIRLGLLAWVAEWVRRHG